jgi:hypothetical protein
MEASQMRATVLYGEHGKIIAISKVSNLKEAGSKFTKASMVPGPGQRMIETELSREDESRPLSELHKEYHVDVASSKLAKKPKP